MTEKILKNEFPIILSYLINNKLKQYEPKCNIQKKHRSQNKIYVGGSGSRVRKLGPMGKLGSWPLSSLGEGGPLTL